MHSQIYVAGRLISNPEIGLTKKGKPWVKLLIETELVRADGRSGAYQVEQIILPINCFSQEAEAVKDLCRGDPVVAGCHLYGTRFETQVGEVKHGVQLIADTVYRHQGREGS
jgi:single-stranded DNA-binding protein